MTACEFTHYCVEDFGAVGHATTPTFDSTAAIQAAFDTAKVKGGRVCEGRHGNEEAVLHGFGRQ
jgi:hypothetical protein